MAQKKDNFLLSKTTAHTVTAAKGIAHHVKVQGRGAPLVLIHALGVDHRLFEPMIAHLPDGIQIIRYDIRGHGQTDTATPPYSMGGLVTDAESILTQLNAQDAVVLGVSFGGMIAQGLAVKRLDLVRGLILSNTAAKIGRPEMWQDRIALIKDKSLPATTDDLMEKWFGRDMRYSPLRTTTQDRVNATDPSGYIGCCHAIAGTDFYTPTGGLRLPTLGIAGSEDGSTPADLVRETTDLIPGSQFKLMRRAGHMAVIEQPETYAQHVTEFLRSIGHLPN